MNTNVVHYKSVYKYMYTMNKNVNLKFIHKMHKNVSKCLKLYEID